MKPLPESHFTPEDWDVMIDVVLRCGRIVDGSMFGYWVMERSRQSDRRDASAMYLAQTSNGNHVYTDGKNRWGVGGDLAPEYDPQENWVRVRLRVQI